MLKNLLKKWICNGCLYKQANPDRPKSIQHINLAWIKRIFKDNGILNANFSDNVYGITTLGQAKTFTRKTQIQDIAYYAEKFDCDDFAFSLKAHWCKGLEGFAFGIAWSESHAFNIAVVQDNQTLSLFIVEPQDNLWFKVEDVKDIKKYWPLKLIII